MLIKNNFLKMNLSLILPISLIIIIITTSLLDNFLLFHFFAEFFAIFVALSIGIVIYFTFSFTQNRYLLFLGLGYVWVGILDLFHMLTYPGMNIFEVKEADTTLTIWVLTRLFESLLLLIAPFIRYTKFNTASISLLFFLFSFAICTLAFVSPMTLFINESGLTLVKNSFEYTIVFILLLALFVNKFHIKEFGIKIYYSIQAAIILTIMAELSFTTYLVWNGMPTIFGHVFKFLSFWIIFESILKISLIKPIELLEKNVSSYNAIPIPSIIVSNDGIIRQVNKATLDDLNMNVEDIIGKSNHTLFHPSNLTKVRCNICKAIENKEELNELELYDNINNKYYKYSLSQIDNKDENLGIIQVRRDITKSRLIEKEKTIN